jgi:hypothetical protein
MDQPSASPSQDDKYKKQINRLQKKNILLKEYVELLD